MSDTPATTNTSLSPRWGSRDDVRELSTRIKTMLPGASKLSPNEIAALGQAALIHGLDPFNGEVWVIPGRGMMIGVKGLRKKAREQVKGNFWIDFREITNAEERERLRIPADALAYEARLFDTENITAYANTVEKFSKAGAPWEWIVETIGSKPYTVGYGVHLKGESTKMLPVQAAMKRAEADAIKRRFDVPFGFEVSESEEPSGAGFIIEGEPDTGTSDESEQRKRDREALYGKDE